MAHVILPRVIRFDLSHIFADVHMIRDMSMEIRDNTQSLTQESRDSLIFPRMDKPCKWLENPEWNTGLSA
jgi:hypothetical protein